MVGLLVAINQPDTPLFFNPSNTTFDHNSLPAPEAYVIITNNPYQYTLESKSYRSAVVVEGFKISDFRYDSVYNSLREALEARSRHLEIEQFVKSMRVHYEIPSTFDGEIPELEYHQTESRLLIGNKYLVPKDDSEVTAELIDGTVLEE